jgi:hypothetical protein
MNTACLRSFARRPEVIGEMAYLPFVVVLWVLIVLAYVGLFVAEGRRTARERANRTRRR